jgi:hypothetical protein
VRLHYFDHGRKRRGYQGLAAKFEIERAHCLYSLTFLEGVFSETATSTCSGKPRFPHGAFEDALHTKYCDFIVVTALDMVSSGKEQARERIRFWCVSGKPPSPEEGSVRETPGVSAMFLS